MARFDTIEEAQAEFARLKAQLEERKRVLFMIDLSERGEILPAEFLEGARAGELTTLLVAADQQDERGEDARALLLRAAYHQLAGEKGVVVKAGRSVIVFGGGSPAFVRLSAAVITPGKSIHVVATKETNEKLPSGQYGLVRAVTDHTFQIGDSAEYDSYNLSYYGPIKSISEKTVVISDKYGGKKTSRLKIHDFVWRNYDFNENAAWKRNSEWSD